jgi:hypothetical protein
MAELMERPVSVAPMVYTYCGAVLHADTAVQRRLCGMFHTTCCRELGVRLRHTVRLRIQNTSICHRPPAVILT